MSKIVASIPKGLMRNSIVGAMLALASYVALQFLSALLIYTEAAGEGMMYPMVCAAALLSSFLGCGYSVMKGGAGSVLSASAVVLVFLSLTAATALVIGEEGTAGGGMTGVGAAMAAGGLAASMLPGLRVKRGKTHIDGRRKRRARK